MPAGSTDLIVHQYDGAPAFSTKTRLMLGFKNAQWYACNQPTILPKDELFMLSGGYRQIPVAQVGADIYCGSELVLDLLEARVPEPPLTARSGPGIGRGLAYWAEESLFWLVSSIVCASGFQSMEDPQFIEDRQKMVSGGFDLATMQAALPANIRVLRMHLDLVERQLEDGRAWFFGDAPDLVDITLAFPLDFLRFCRNGNEHIVAEYPRILAWMKRVKALGHGQRQEITPEEAIAVARAATPAMRTPRSTVKEGPQPGTRVRVTWSAYSPLDLEGEVVEAHARRMSVAWTSPAAGDLVIHFLPGAGRIVCC